METIRFSKHLLKLARDPAGVCRSVIARLHTLIYRIRLRALQFIEGGVVWRKKGGYWLPYHGCNDDQELYYQMHGEQWFKAEEMKVGRWLPKGGVVLDVGANIGFTSLIFSTAVGGDGKVLAFEPSGLTFPRLQKVLERNSVTNVLCMKKGCGSLRRTETLVVPSSSGNATIKREGVELAGRCTEVQIEIDRLDDMVLPLVDRVDFLKIDTEGFEDQVLSGAELVLSKYAPVVYIELSQEYSESSSNAIEILRRHGYHFTVDPDLSQAHNGDNFLAIPSQKLDAARES